MAATKAKVQGEGDYDAARRHRGKLKSFIASHDVEKVARAAAPRSAAEAKSMQEAEARGKARSKAKTSATPGRAR